MEGARSDNSSEEDIEIITTNKGLPVNKGLGKRESSLNSQRKRAACEIRADNPKTNTGNQKSQESKEFDVKIKGKSQTNKAPTENINHETKIKYTNEPSENPKLEETHKETIIIKVDLDKSEESKFLTKSNPQFMPKTLDKVNPAPNINPEYNINPELFIDPKSHQGTRDFINPESQIKPTIITQDISPISSDDKKNIENLNKSGINHKAIPKIPATISSNINIKKIPAEELSKILSNILSHLIPLIDTNKFFLNQDKILDEIDKIKFSGCEAASQLLEHLKSYQCSRCQSKSLKIQLSCKHSFCESCTDSFQIVPSLENPNQSTLLCPICTQQITENEFNQLFPQKNQRILAVENEFLLEKLKTKSFLKCRICNKNKANFFKTCCYHMCRDCVAENIRLNKLQCSICTTSFTNLDDILHEMVLCDNCQVKGYYIGDYMKAIEGEKCTLCSLCLNKTLNQGMCQRCEKKVSKAEKLEISDFLFTKCGVCDEEIFRGYVNFNTCCQSKVCVGCNGEGEICKKCGYRNS